MTAGAAAAKRVGTVISVHVIARPDRQLHVASNGAQPVEKLATSPIMEATVAKPAKTKPIAAEAPVVAENIAPSSSGCEVSGLQQAEMVPVQDVSEIWQEPAKEEPSHEDQPEVETANDYAAEKGRSPVEEEAEEAAVGATRGFLAHKKEKVRKPRSKRKA